MPRPHTWPRPTERQIPNKALAKGPSIHGPSDGGDAYDSAPIRARIRRRRGEAMIARRCDGRSSRTWNAAKRAWNAAIRPVRSKIEKVFGTAKRSYGPARTRYRGRRRVSLQVHLTFLAYNLRRAVALMRTAPAASPA